MALQRPAGAPDALGRVPGVEGVEALPGGRLRLRCARDVRADVARAAVDFGLLEMTSGGGLEAHYLRLTSAPAPVAAEEE